MIIDHELKINPKHEIRNPKQNLNSNFIIDGPVKSQNITFLSFRRKPESSHFNTFWMPDQVRHDELGLFTNSSLFEFRIFSLIIKT